jgi:hypothetical protein
MANQLDTSDTTTAAVVAGTTDSRRTHRRGIVRLLSAIVLLALLIGCLVLFAPKHSTKLDLPLDPNAPNDYALMTPVQIRARLYHDTGLDINELQTKKLSGRTFKNFTAAYDTAKAFNGLKAYDKSLAAYAIAQSKADKQTGYEFYIDYAAVADIQKNPTLSNQEIDKAKQAIQADKSLSASLKQDMTAKIEMKQRIRQQTGKQ